MTNRNFSINLTNTIVNTAFILATPVIFYFGIKSLIKSEKEIKSLEKNLN